MSAPAAKARSLPPTTSARMSVSASSSCNAATSAPISPPESAFNCFGRLSRTIATWPSRSTSTSSSVGSVKLGELDDRLREAAFVGVLARRHELLAARRGLEGVLVRELPLGVVRMRRLAHRRTCDLAVAEDAVRDLLAELDVLGVGVGIRRLVVQDDDAMHCFLSVAGALD